MFAFDEEKNIIVNNNYDIVESINKTENTNEEEKCYLDYCYARFVEKFFSHDNIDIANFEKLAKKDLMLSLQSMRKIKERKAKIA